MARAKDLDRPHRVARHHENTITVGVEVDGEKKYFNIPTIERGKQLSTVDAIDKAFQKKSLGKGFNTLTEAVEAAKKRSQAAGKKKGKK